MKARGESMLFDDAFLSEVSSDPVQCAITAIDRARSSLVRSREWTEGDLHVLTEVFALLEEMQSAKLLNLDTYSPDLGVSLSQDCTAINEYLDAARASLLSLQTKDAVAIARARFRSHLGGSFAYEFSQGDLNRVQTLINELREQIGSATYFEPDHQRRLLKRLERLQGELHKKVADLDRFWGLVGDAGVAMGKFGTNAKPIVDRIREIAEIVWQTQAHAEELPSGTNLPSLGRDSGESTREA
jgi:uncharacterized protein YoxC